MKKTFLKYLNAPPFTEALYREQLLVDADFLYNKVTRGAKARKAAKLTKVRGLLKRHQLQWEQTRASLKTLKHQAIELRELDVAAKLDRCLEELGRAKKVSEENYNIFLRLGKKGSGNPVGNVFEALKRRHQNRKKGLKRIATLDFCILWLRRFWMIQGRAISDKQWSSIVELLSNQQKNIHKVGKRRAAEAKRRKAVQHRILQLEKKSKVRS